MYSSRMRTARSLTVSHHIPYMPPTTHKPPQPCMPPTTMHTPPQPCMPPIIMHAPCNHACPPTTTHAPRNHTCPPPQPHILPQQPCLPLRNHACPPTTMHAPPVNRMTNRCKNITLPQTSFAGGKNTRMPHADKLRIWTLTSRNQKY